MSSTSWFAVNMHAAQQKDEITQQALYAAKSVLNYETYYTWQQAKNGAYIPLRNDMALYSRYNPQEDAKKTIAVNQRTGCTVFWGLGAGYHVKAYIDMLNNSPLNTYERILIIEPHAAGLRNILEHCDISAIIQNYAVSIAVYDTEESQQRVDDFLQAHFNPVLQKTFACIPLRITAQSENTLYDELRNRISVLLEKVKNDFSVQVHFGKIWIRNILENCTITDTADFWDVADFCRTNQRYAVAVAAAGPSLEEHIPFLQTNRHHLFIIATDTAYQILQAAQITADMIVSIDGQSVSIRHIMHGLSNTPFAAVDMCANSVLVRAVHKAGCRMLLLQGGHPLEQMIAQYTKQYPCIFTGAGTVTATAVDIASKIGYSSIFVVGADFANTGGKPYARGSYLADSYDTGANRLHTSETSYTALLFRTECRKNGLTYSSPVLDRYREALNHYCRANNITITVPADNTIIPESALPCPQKKHQSSICGDINDCVVQYTTALTSLHTALTCSSKSQTLSAVNINTLYTVLPLAAWFLTHRPDEDPVTAAIAYTIKLIEK